MKIKYDADTRKMVLDALQKYDRAKNNEGKLPDFPFRKEEIQVILDIQTDERLLAEKELMGVLELVCDKES